MQINSSKSPNALYGTNQDRLQTQPDRTAQNPRPSKTDKSLTVAISPEAQALQKEAEAKKADSARESDKKQAMQQQAKQGLQAQRPAAKATTQQIDIAV